MKTYLLILSISAIFLSLSGCGKDRQQKEIGHIAKAEAYLNNKQYLEAIYTLRRIPPRILKEKGKDDLLAYAYLGFLELDSNRIYEIINNAKSHIKTDFSDERLHQVMAIIPDLDNRLFQLFNYALMGLEKSEALKRRDPELRNFYLGNLYVYRLLINLKRLYRILIKIEETNQMPSTPTTPLIIALLEDLGFIETHYSKSYTKLSLLVRELEEKLYLWNGNDN